MELLGFWLVWALWSERKRDVEKSNGQKPSERESGGEIKKDI